MGLRMYSEHRLKENCVYLLKKRKKKKEVGGGEKTQRKEILSQILPQEIIESPELEGTHKDPKVLALHRSPQQSHHESASEF